MKEIIVPSEKKQLANVLDFINKNLDSLNPSSKFRMQLELSIEETFVNIINYTYKTNSESKITIKYNIEYDESDTKKPLKVVVEISDTGSPFNPLKNKDPDITLSSYERKIGGLGILLLKKNVDNIDYKYENKRNVLTIEKEVQYE